MPGTGDTAHVALGQVFPAVGPAWGAALIQIYGKTELTWQASWRRCAAYQIPGPAYLWFFHVKRPPSPLKSGYHAPRSRQTCWESTSGLISCCSMIDPADYITQPLLMPAPVALHMDTSVKLIQAELIQDLVGCWMVIQTWTAKNGGRNGRKVTMVDSQEAGLVLLDRLVKRHQKTAASTA
jgi:hypothetical protein